MHNLTLNVNKIEGDCARNKMIMEKKIEELINRIFESSRNDN